MERRLISAPTNQTGNREGRRVSNPLPLMTPAMYARLCPMPIRMMLMSVEIPCLPMSMLELTVVMFKPAEYSSAICCWNRRQ
jgi:hypothetical protein